MTQNAVDYDTLLRNFDELNQFIEQAKQQMQNKSTGLIEEAARRLFEAAPEIEHVHWTQYTPYFNDGEACEFEVNDICYKLWDDEEWENDYYDSSTLYGESDLERARADYQEAAKFEDDPEAWREEYVRKYRQKWNREPWNYGSIRPYPSTRKEAQAKIDLIEASLAKYDVATVDRIKKSFRAFEDAMRKIPDDIMESVYGDHVCVVISRTGTEIDEFDHD